MADAAVILFLLCAVVFWGSTFGYLLTLQCLALLKRDAGSPCPELPPVAILVPVLNEERLIREKLENLCASDYPADRRRIIVVDGGSTDRTVPLVERAMREDRSIRLLRVEGAGGKAAQINHALGQVAEELVVVTDADARLDRSCLSELVRELASDPRTALVGAAVRPDAVLPEERAYWWFINRLWWLEGRALHAAMVSAACYALRRAQVPCLPGDVHCDDAFMMMAAGARGARVRHCPAAKATELRVPRSLPEVLEFRFRRGRGYLRELCRVMPAAGAHRGWRVTRWMRWYHFRVTPLMTVALAVLALAVAAAGRGGWVLAVLGVFAVSVAAVFAPVLPAGCGRVLRRWPRGAVAGAGAAVLTWYTLMRIGLGAGMPREGRSSE